MNDIVNKFLLVGNKFMPETHPANIVPQNVRRTSLSNDPRTSPKGPV